MEESRCFLITGISCFNRKSSTAIRARNFSINITCLYFTSTKWTKYFNHLWHNPISKIINQKIKQNNNPIKAYLPDVLSNSLSESIEFYIVPFLFFLSAAQPPVPNPSSDNPAIRALISL